MKFICIALTAIWLILSPAELAYGEPVTAAIFGAVFASSFAGQLVTLAIGMAFNLGVGLIQKARAKRKAKDQTKGISFELQVGDDQPMSFTLGSYAAGGRRKYTGIHGTNGRYLVDVIELGNIPCPGTPSFWVNDQKVTVNWADPDSDGKGYPVHDFDIEGNILLWVKYYDGTQTAADPYLIAKFGTEADRPFTSDMIGLGCPYLIVTARFHPETFPQVPSVLTEMPVRRVYDLRKDSTNGGTGAQRWDDQSTWEPSSNPIVNIYNIVRGIYFENEWVYGGQNLAAFRLPASNWIAAANECDVDIALSSGGTEKQFRCGYEVFCDVEPLTVIEELLQTCSGRMAEVGGIFKVMVGAPGAAVFSFTDADVLVTEGQSFNPFPPFSDTHNGIEATYPEPAEKWATKDAPARYSSTYMTADLDQQLVVGVEFEACPFKTQVQRLTKTMLQEERRFRTHEFYLPPSAWRLEPNDVVSWTSARNGYINKKFLVVRVVGRRTFNQLVSLKEIDPSDYDWSASEELPTVVGPVKPIYPPAQAMTGWTAVGYTVLDTNSRARRPGIKVTATVNLDDVKNVRVQVRLKSSGAVVFDSDATPYDAPYEWVISGQWTLPNTLYQARGKFMPFTNRQTLWGAWLDVTTPDIQFISEDILDGAIVSSKINDAAIIASKIATDAVTSLKLAASAVTEAKIAVDAVTRNVIKNGEIIAEKIANGAVELTKFAAGLTPVEGPFAAAPTTGNFEGRVATIGASPNAKLMRYTGGAWTAAVPATDMTGQITSTQITDNAITTPKIMAGAVITASLAAGAVTASTIATDAVTASKIQAGAIVADKVAANVIGAKHLIVADWENLILDGTFDQALTSFTDIWAMNPNNFTAGGGSVGDPPSFWVWGGDSITGKQSLVIDNKTPGGSGASMFMDTKDLIPCTAGDTLAWEIANRTTEAGGSLTGHYLRFYWYTRTGAAASPASNDAVSNQPIPFAWTVLRGQIVVPAGATQFRVRVYNSSASTVRYNIIDRVVVRKAKGASLIVDGTIIADHLAANSVTATAIAANSVTAAKILAGTITGDRIAGDTITGAKIAANTISGDLIVANAITARELILTDYSNIYPDYDFQAQSGFYVGTTPSFSGTSVVTRGRFALRLFANAAAQDTYSQWISIGQGEYYADVVANMAAATVGGGTATCILEFGTGVGTGAVTFVSQIVVLARTDSSSTARGGVAFTVGSGIKFFRAQFNRAAGGTEDAFFGGLMVRKKQNANLIVDGAITADHLAVNSVIAGAIAAGAITAGKLAVDSVVASNINVSTLSAISATLGSVNISSAIIGTLTVGTSNIAAGAITLVETNTLAGGSWGGGTRDVSVAVAHGTGSPEVIVMGMAGCTMGGFSATEAWSVSARAASTEIGKVNGTLDLNEKGGMTVIARHVPASGTSSTTYTVRLTATNGIGAADMLIVVQVLKR
ncbi:phage tail protein [Pararhizobium sp. YC-54]|uniref:phage tail protein n=1 Tax=Pararhizobium sp. YC-54 TaxID=2986920 RepID=UPI0021F719EB|nr:phage tail protein [Pararhizobium sp. YC-54]MCV9997319.1 phage tail protein [Pararhizobium sp. YC-54]